MDKQIFVFFSVLLVSATHGGPITDDGSSGAYQSSDPGTYAFEEQLLEILEKLRNVMKNGDASNEIPPMEPVKFESLHFDFYLKDTQLKGVFRDTVIHNLSDFQIKNLSITLTPKMSIKIQLTFDELRTSGFYNLLGVLFAEFPVNGSGMQRIVANNVSVSAEMLLRSKAGVLHVTDLKAGFNVRSISVRYVNLYESEEHEVEEGFVLGLLDRAQVEYLPPLLEMLKVLINDFLQTMSNREYVALVEFLANSEVP